MRHLLQVVYKNYSYTNETGASYYKIKTKAKFNPKWCFFATEERA